MSELTFVLKVILGLLTFGVTAGVVSTIGVFMFSFFQPSRRKTIDFESAFKNWQYYPALVGICWVLSDLFLIHFGLWKICVFPTILGLAIMALVNRNKFGILIYNPNDKSKWF